MHLLYLDHSGDPADPQLFHFVIAGISCFERQTHWLSRQLDAIAARFSPDDPSAVELHANPMITGNRGWKVFPVSARRQAVMDALAAIRDSHASNALFGVCKDKRAVPSNDLLYELFEDILSRFPDRQLLRLHRNGNTQRGLIVFDKASYESKVQNWTAVFQTQGHSWGVIRNLAEFRCSWTCVPRACCKRPI